MFAHSLQPHIEQPAPVNRQSSHLKEIVLIVVAVWQYTAHVLEQLCSQGKGQQERRASDDGSVERTQGKLAISDREGGFVSQRNKLNRFWVVCVICYLPMDDPHDLGVAWA